MTEVAHFVIISLFYFLGWSSYESEEDGESMEGYVPSPGHSSFEPFDHDKPSGLALEKENYVIKHAEEKLNSEVKIIAHSSSFYQKGGTTANGNSCSGKGARAASNPEEDARGPGGQGGQAEGVDRGPQGEGAQHPGSCDPPEATGEEGDA